MPDNDWRHSAERMARLEADIAVIKSDMIWVKADMQAQAMISVKTANDIGEIKISLVKDNERRSMLRYVGHAAAVALGGILGAITGHRVP